MLTALTVYVKYGPYMEFRSITPKPIISYIRLSTAHFIVERGKLYLCTRAVNCYFKSFLEVTGPPKCGV